MCSSHTAAGHHHRLYAGNVQRPGLPEPAGFDTHSPEVLGGDLATDQDRSVLPHSLPHDPASLLQPGDDLELALPLLLGRVGRHLDETSQGHVKG